MSSTWPSMVVVNEVTDYLAALVGVPVHIMLPHIPEGQVQVVKDIKVVMLFLPLINLLEQVVAVQVRQHPINQLVVVHLPME